MNKNKETDMRRSKIRLKHFICDDDSKKGLDERIEDFMGKTGVTLDEFVDLKFSNCEAILIWKEMEY